MGMDNTDSKCALCGERFRPCDEIAEMYDPRVDDSVPSVVVHGDCGISAGMELA